jgi:hypothetical protein
VCQPDQSEVIKSQSVVISGIHTCVEDTCQPDQSEVIKSQSVVISGIHTCVEDACQPDPCNLAAG